MRRLRPRIVLREGALLTPEPMKEKHNPRRAFASPCSAPCRRWPGRGIAGCFLGRTLKGKRGRATLLTFLFHGLRREELWGLDVEDIQQRSGVAHLRIHDKGEKTRFVPAHPDRASEGLTSPGDEFGKPGAGLRGSGLVVFTLALGVTMMMERT